MPPVVFPNAVAMRLIFTHTNGKQFSVTFNTRNTNATPIDATIVDVFGSQAKSLFTSSGLAALIASSVSLTALGVRNISTANQPEILDSTPAVPGTGANDALPFNVASLVKTHTALAGQSFQGRMYFAGFMESQNDVDGTPLATVANTATAYANALRVYFAGVNIPMAILSMPRPADPTHVPPIDAWPGALTPITSMTPSNVARWFTQRRRL